MRCWRGSRWASRESRWNVACGRAPVSLRQPMVMMLMLLVLLHEWRGRPLSLYVAEHCVVLPVGGLGGGGGLSSWKLQLLHCRGLQVA